MKTTLPCTQQYCGGCSLRFSGRKLPTEVHHDTVSDGNPQVDVLVLTEFPNATEHQNESPVATKGGFEMRRALQEAGITSVAYSNLVRCRPVDKTGSTREPTLEEMTACANHAWQDIARLRPKVVVTMGQLATRALVPYKKWHENGIQFIAGETHVHGGVTFFPIPSPYLWAFDDNPYPHRQRLRTLTKLLGQIVRDELPPYSKLGHTHYCGTLPQVEAAIRRIRSLDSRKNPADWCVGLDTEGQNVNRVATNGLSCIQFGVTDDLALTIPIDHHDTDWTPEERAHVIKLLADLFTDDTLNFECWAAHEDKFDLNQILRTLGISRFALPTVDPIFLDFLNDENLRAKSDEGDDNDSFRSSAGLKSMMLMWCNFRHYDPDILSVRTQHEGFWRLPLNVDRYQGPQRALAQKFLDYGGMDAYNARRLAKTLRQAMDSRGYTKAYNLAKNFGSRVTHLFRSMERNGVCIDRPMLEFLRGPTSPILARLQEIPDEIYDTPECKEANKRVLGGDKKTAGMSPLFGQQPWLFDIRKKDHLVHLFVGVCGLAPVKPTKLGEVPPIDRHFYAKHDYHPIVQQMQEYTGLFKLQSSYTKAVHEYLTDPKHEDNQVDGRLHPSFWKTRTLTGRLASAGPSVHQIPRADNFAKQCIKSLVAAAPGYVLLEGDYGQAEVRWWAQIADDADFIQMFWNMWEIQEEYYRNPTPENRKRKEFECDVHRQVASLMFNVPIADVSKDQRQAAKSIVFGCIYGQSAKALAQILKIGDAEAAALQAKFIGRFTKAGPWLTEIEEVAKAQGYVEAPNGRRRHLRELFLVDEGGTRRQARNSPIQAIASDVMAEAAYLQQRWIEDKGYLDVVKPGNLIHDALLQEVKLDLGLIREVIVATRDNMQHNVKEVVRRDYGFDLKVPMVADFKMGLRWGHAYDWDQGSDLDAIVAKLRDQTARLEAGAPFWHIAVEEGRKDAAKDRKKAEDEAAKATDPKAKSKAEGKVRRVSRHQQYLERLILAA